MKCVTSYTKIRLAVYIAVKDDLTRTSLLTRRSTLLLKMGVSYGW